MAGDAVPATGRKPGQQVRYGRVTERAVPKMGNINRRILDRARIVTVQTRSRSASHIPGRHMVDAAMRGQILVRMAIQAMGRVGAQCDGINDFLPRAAVTGGTGSGAVGVDIVLDAFDFRPISHHMTVAAGLPRRSIGEVVGANFHRVGEIAMTGRLVGVAVQTRNLRATLTLLNGLSNGCRVHICSAIAVAESAVGPVEHVDVGVTGE